MDIFAAQDQARRTTQKLVVLQMFLVPLFAAVIAIFLLAPMGWLDVTQPEMSFAFSHYFWLWLAGTVLVSGLLAGVAFSRWRQLQAGGKAIARRLSARMIDPQTQAFSERQILNVVEEMCIAATLPTLPVYVLDREYGINAAAIGWEMEDVVLIISAGCLDACTRDEMQAIVAHELGHVWHGDPGLKVRLVALVAGMMFFSHHLSKVLAPPPEIDQGSNGPGQGTLQEKTREAELAKSRRAPLRHLPSSAALDGFQEETSADGGRRKRRRVQRQENHEHTNFVDRFVVRPLLIIVVVVYGMLLVMVASLAAVFSRCLQAAVSRQREFLADASALQFTRNPAAMARVFDHIHQHPMGSRMENPALRQFNCVFLAPIYGQEGLLWMASHPSISQRRARLRLDAYAGTSREVSPAKAVPAQQVSAPVSMESQVCARPPVDLLLLAMCCRGQEEAIQAVHHDLAAEQQGQFAELAAKGRPDWAQVLGMRPALMALPEPRQRQLLRYLERAVQADGRLDFGEWLLTRLVSNWLCPPRLDRDPGRTSRHQGAIRLLGLLARSGGKQQAAGALNAGLVYMDMEPVAGMPAHDFQLIDEDLRAWRAAPGSERRRLMEAAKCTAYYDGHLAGSEKAVIHLFAIALGGQARD